MRLIVQADKRPRSNHQDQPNSEIQMAFSGFGPATAVAQGTEV
ncbi:hypothetical protein N5079_14880 [Planotetraspora sp. A-T 1434]|nr:hypothetical protein [Planotetraspora sp. A-T 1434]MCT9931501.1 hypothetical protein [Planotetraspora sp. A-T 1434]